MKQRATKARHPEQRIWSACFWWRRKTGTGRALGFRPCPLRCPRHRPHQSAPPVLLAPSLVPVCAQNSCQHAALGPCMNAEMH